MKKSKQVGLYLFEEVIIMVKIVIAFFFVVLHFSVTANANQISQTWNKTYGGTNAENLGTIQQTLDGGYILAGSTGSFVGGIASILVLKLNNNGDITWQKIFKTGTYADAVYSVQQTVDRGYILAGFVFPPRNDLPEALILKLDSQGNLEWKKTYLEIIELRSIQQTADQGYVACGGHSILKLNNTGDVSWHSVVTGPVEFDNIFQTSDGGYLTSGIYRSNNNYDDTAVAKFDDNGNIIWQKTYGASRTDWGMVHQISDEEYFITSSTYSFSTGTGMDAWLLKLDTNGDILWQRIYDAGYYDCGINSILKTSDGGYLVGGSNTYELGNKNLWLLKLADNGDIIWEKSYGGNAYDGVMSIQETSDTGYVVHASTESFGAGNSDFWVLKIDSDGDIPDCDIIDTSDTTIFDTSISGLESHIPIESSPLTTTGTNLTFFTVSVETSTVCYYVDPTDIDGDGIANNSTETIVNSMHMGSFLTAEDNCLETPNGPYLGTCTKGNVGSTCIANEACGNGGTCSMNQEDTFPPQGNGLGDACDCEGDFDCDGDCDGTDASKFKVDFGRSAFENPCKSSETCNGDFDCDGDCDGTDAAVFKLDFGRSTFLTISVLPVKEETGAVTKLEER
jgi:hypothetical protein